MLQSTCGCTCKMALRRPSRSPGEKAKQRALNKEAANTAAISVQQLMRIDQVPNRDDRLSRGAPVQDLMRIDRVPNRRHKMRAPTRRKAAQTWFQNAQIRVHASSVCPVSRFGGVPSRPGGGTWDILAQKGRCWRVWGVRWALPAMAAAAKSRLDFGNCLGGSEEKGLCWADLGS